MGMLLFSKRQRIGWKAGAYKEKDIALPNPGRGWYRIHTYIVENTPVSRPAPEMAPGESLALVLINIGYFCQEKLSADALRDIGEILEGFVCGGADMIVRVCYDTEGRGMEREPSLFSLIQEHIEQLAPILVRYSDNILVYQGVLVGNWGEMHGSKFLGKKYLSALTRTFLEKTEGKISLAFRKPVQYRQIFAQGVRSDQLGFYNDAILASETCLGTFADMLTEKGEWEEPWNFLDEAQFMAEYAGNIPYGGEVLTGNEDLSADEILRRLGLLRVSYLNAVYDGKLLEGWKKLAFKEGNFYDYVGQHLGYRLVVVGTHYKSGKDPALCVEIENRGFGPFLLKADFLLYAQAGGESRQLPRTKEDLYGLMPGQKKQLSFPLEESSVTDSPGKLAVYAVLTKRSDGRRVYLANESEEGRLFLGMLCVSR